MNQLTKVFEGNEIRVIEENSTPLFVASDVAKVLGYKRPNDAVNQHCKGATVKHRIIDGLGREQEMRVIRESDVYRLVINSKLAVAEKFETWVMEEVLPSVRKDGGYIVAQPDESPEVIMARGLIAAQSTIERMKVEQEVAIATIEEQKPKALFADAVSTSSDSILVGQLAKMLKQNGVDTGGTRLFADLRRDGYLCKHGANYNEPTQYAADRGWFEVLVRTNNNPDGSVRINRTTKVTGKGQIYFVNKYLGGTQNEL